MDAIKKHRSHISGKRYIRRYRDFVEAQDKRMAELESWLLRNQTLSEAQEKELQGKDDYSVDLTTAIASVIIKSGDSNCIKHVGE